MTVTEPPSAAERDRQGGDAQDDAPTGETHTVDDDPDTDVTPGGNPGSEDDPEPDPGASNDGAEDDAASDGGDDGTDDDGDEPFVDEHLRDVEPGAGCTEIWEHLSERREE